MTRVLATSAASLLLLVAAGCGGGDDDSLSDDGGGAAATTTTEKSKPEGVGGGKEKQAGGGSGSTVAVNDSRFGRILTDGDGRTLYLFDKEKTDRSECFGACATAWPPFFTKGEPRAGGSAKDNLVGTTDHEGRTQVTYNGHPLYYYEGDTEPGVVGCHNVQGFGGLWLVVDPGGDAIQ